MRPSFINQFKAVIDFGSNTPDSFLRDLIVRNITLVAVGREPRTYSSHAVLIDRPLATSLLARDMMLGGPAWIIEREALVAPWCGASSAARRS